MRAFRSGAVIAVLALIAGCAGAITSPEAIRGLGPCLPAEISPQFFFWPVVAFRPMNLFTEDGEATPASMVIYHRGKSEVAVIWVGSDLISVDPSPESDAPEWIDMSLVTPVDEKLVLRRTPDTPCQWKRMEGRTDAALLRSGSR